MSAEGQDKIRQIVTDKVLAALESGVAPWHQGWSTTSGGLPRSFTGHTYRGVNVFLLALSGYSSPFWGTINHKGTGTITKAGGTVRDGEQATLVVFWKRFTKRVQNEETGQWEVRSFATLRYYNVFNAEQCDGLPDKFFPAKGEVAPEHPEASVIAKEYFERDGAPSLDYGGDRAYYLGGHGILVDHVQLPPQDAFDDDAEFQATRFHEMAHSTGHPKRLHRPGIEKFDHFGSEQYGKEELVAEMTAAMLLATCNLEVHFDNNAAYIGSWIRTIKGDNKLVISAAAQAQHAVDFILGIKYEEDSAS